MESIDEIKRVRRAKKAILKRKIEEANQEIDDLISNEAELYVNGEAAELREVCRKNKERLKVRVVK